MAAHWASERARFDSLGSFAPLPASTRQAATTFLEGLERLVDEAPPAPVPDETPVYRRRPDPKGPMEAFGYSFLDDQLRRKKLPKPALLQHQGLWQDGEVVAYEALNLVDGQRSVRRIRDTLSAFYGPVPLDMVVEYLHALEQIDVLDRVPSPP
jgi:hypothetical protein